MNHFNRLTPAQAERLAMLAEECAEVVQVVGKILRHGYDSYHPNDLTPVAAGGKTELLPKMGARDNRRLLSDELTDLEAIVEMMFATCDLTHPRTGSAISEAISKKLAFSHHQTPEDFS